MARKSNGRQSTGRTTGPRGSRMEGARLMSPTIDWSQPAPQQANLPDVADLVKLSVPERQRILKEFGITRPWEKMRSDAAEYLARMSDLQYGTDAYNLELNRLASSASKRGSLQNTRAAYRQFETLEMMRGKDPATQEFIRVTEGDEHVCSPCDGLGGEEGTMAYHSSIGLPGPASCEGGNYCRCGLLLLD